MKENGKLTVLLAAAALLATSCLQLMNSGEIQVRTFEDGAPMARVLKGDFTMGNNTGDADERPEHTVTLENYWIDLYEVTNEQYAGCVKEAKCRDNVKYDGFTDPRQPVVGVSWLDAARYCEWAQKRLPTEAEWEKAARGDDGRDYPWGDELDCTRANYRECGRNSTMPVGSYPNGKSPYGAFDMAGNAAEWVVDWYDPNYYSAQDQKVNPKGPDNGKYRVIRGGMWLRYAYQMESPDRAAQTPDTRNNSTGFRCAKDD